MVEIHRFCGVMPRQRDPMPEDLRFCRWLFYFILFFLNPSFFFLTTVKLTPHFDLSGSRDWVGVVKPIRSKSVASAVNCEGSKANCAPWPCASYKSTTLGTLFLGLSPQIRDRHVSFLETLCLRLLPRALWPDLESDWPFTGDTGQCFFTSCGDPHVWDSSVRVCEYIFNISMWMCIYVFYQQQNKKVYPFFHLRSCTYWLYGWVFTLTIEIGFSSCQTIKRERNFQGEISKGASTFEN